MFQTNNSRMTCITEIISKATVLTEEPGSPAINTNGLWSLRVGHVNGVNLHFEFPETEPTKRMTLKFEGEPTAISVTQKSLERLSTATLRELRDCFAHTSYRTLKAGQRHHRELQSR